MAKKLYKRVLAVSLGTLLAFGLAECLVRLFWKPPEGGYPAGLFRRDDAIGYGLVPGFRAQHRTPEFNVEIAIDAHGFRNHDREPVSGRYILSLGDSFSFGHGVEAADCYPAKLQAKLSTDGQRVSVINAGVPGYGTGNHLAVLRRILGDADGAMPQVVLASFYIGNDFRDNYEARFGRLVARSGVLIARHREENTLWFEVKSALLSNCRTLQALYVGVSGLRAVSEDEQVAAHCKSLPWDAGFSAAMVSKNWEPDAEGAYTESIRLLNEVADVCARAGLPLLVVLIPAPFQYNPALWDIVCGKCRLKASDFDMDKPSSLLMGWAKSRSVACVDLLPAFRAVTVATGQQLYIDVHFNVAGHELAATEIAKAMSKAAVPQSVR